MNNVIDLKKDKTNAVEFLRDVFETVSDTPAKNVNGKMEKVALLLHIRDLLRSAEADEKSAD
jgi:hypothetical protein